MDDFETSGRVKVMPNAAKWCYVALLSYQWREGFVPSEVADLAMICGESEGVFRKYWKRLESCFPVCPDGFRRNQRQDKERTKAEIISRKRQAIALGLPTNVPPVSTEFGDVPVIHKPQATGHTSQEAYVISSEDKTRATHVGKLLALKKQANG